MVMESDGTTWSDDENWTMRVLEVLSDFKRRFPRGRGVALSLVDELCTTGISLQADLERKFGLNYDEIGTILGYVTRAIQGPGSVNLPAAGGWYFASGTPRIYRIAPGFAAAWNRRRKSSAASP